EFELLLMLAPPTAVHVVCDCGLAGSMVKMRKPAVAWSAADSPSPVPGTGLVSVSDQLLSVPLAMPEDLISSVHLPTDSLPLRTLSGSCGLNLPKKGAAPFWIGVVAVSSRTVFWKFALLPTLLPTLSNSVIVVPSGAMSVAVRSGSFG